jgi:hypothetical protein
MAGTITRKTKGKPKQRPKRQLAHRNQKIKKEMTIPSHGRKLS